jgi:hypothetical protein
VSEVRNKYSMKLNSKSLLAGLNEIVANVPTILLTV